MNHKAGYVNIVGLPNVGKSTLMNAILGERLSIISPKAQTTRGRLNGIINEEDAQIIFSDTPGYINQPAYELHKSMNHFVHEAFEDADVIMLITDKFQSDYEQQFLIDQCNKTKLPVVVVMNKVDLCKPEELNKHEEKWNKLIPNSRFIAISARENFNTTNLISLVKDFLPESEAYFDKDLLTDRNLRFFVGEIVREKIFLQYEKEIPYSCEVIVEEYKELESIDRIRCIIYVERDSQKNIVIGSGGKAINKLGTEARKEIEAFLDKKVFLDLFVKVRDGWRNNELDLKKFGYKG
jgi:GTP-binding protein Era